jgi:monovalent cation/hydrogen antiporter
LIIQQKLAETALNYVAGQVTANEPQHEYLDNLRARLQLDVRTLTQVDDGLSSAPSEVQQYVAAVYLRVLEQQRSLLNELNRSPYFDEELIRKYAAILDLEEYKLREKQLSSPEPL